MAGRSRGNVAMLAALGGAAAIVAVLTAYVLVTSRAAQTVRVSTVSFDLSTPGQGRLVYDVTKPRARSVVCVVRGRTKGNELAGRVTGVLVGAAAADTVRESTTVPLQVPAVILEVESCELQGTGS